MSLPLLPSLPPLAQAAGNNAIDVRTVLLVLALVGLAYALRQVSLLRAEIETLRTPAAPTPAPAPAAPKDAVAPVAAAAPAPLGPPTPGELVAIFAAVHSVFGGSARLVAVAPVPTSQVMWSLEGRREVFRSHQIR
jgi:hypothetical protein